MEADMSETQAADTASPILSPNFVHLHVHSEYSILESSLRVDTLIDLAVAQQMPAVALTDNASMYGSIDFYLKAKAKGIKPILGCEVFLCENIAVKERARQRLILLAKSHHGYQQLIKLVSASHIDGFYYRPRVDWQLLEQFKEDLIAISPGLNGILAERSISHQDDAAKEACERLATLYPNCFYVGLQNCGLAFESLATKCSVALAKDFNLPLLATNNIYYEKAELAYTRDILGCIQTGRTIEGSSKGRSESDQQYFKSEAEMTDLFQDYPEALSNTLKIAEACDVQIDTDQVFLPHFDCPDKLSSEDYLRKLVWEGIDKKYPARSQEIKDRVAHELDVILRMHYANYFLIIYDFLDFCTKEGIPVGPGRGSAAGSIVAYALDITKIDPLAYNLLFERFLNPERVSMPDIDIDFCIRRRHEVIDYIVQEYGQERVSQIVTFGTMQSRAVVRDVGRALAVPLAEVDFLAKCIPSAPGKYTSIAEALDTIPELKKSYKTNPTHKNLLDTSQVIEGQVRHTSTHAAGVVISRDPLTDVVPLIQNDGQIATQYPMAIIEGIGLLKMDILGLRNLTVMSDALALIKHEQDLDLDIDALPVDDEATYDLLCTGETVGIFQLESQGMQRLVKNLQPRVFEDLIALLALYRPGPLGSGMVDDFISNKKGETQVKYEVPSLEPILAPTYGMIVYQEQVMQIASVIGGFSLGQADMLRRAMGKKKKSVMDQMKLEFLSGAEKKQVPKAKAERIFDLCYKFAEYGFNKSHSAAYALISYQTAYLKAHYPIEYMTALLSSVLGSGEKAALYVHSCKQLGIAIFGPCVNHSVKAFSIEDQCIRLGLAAIKNVGETAIDSIVEKRPKEGGYKDLMDLCLRVDLRLVNKRVLESLIKSGAMDHFDDRNKLLGTYESVLAQAQIKVKARDKGQVSLFAQEDDEDDDFLNAVIEDKGVSCSKLELLSFEKELLGLYISGHPISEYKSQLSGVQHHLSNINSDMEGDEVKVAGLITQYRRIITKRKQPMVSAVIENEATSMDLLVFFKPGIEELMDRFDNDLCMFVTATVKVRDDEVSLLVSDAAVLKSNDSMAFYVNVDHLDRDFLSNFQTWCEARKGASPLILQAQNRCVKTNARYWLKPGPETQAELDAYFGKGRVWVGSI
eukprot:COSAG01_NODE_6_length_54687_cov_500.907599_29_plen_1147_part_00